MVNKIEAQGQLARVVFRLLEAEALELLSGNGLRISARGLWCINLAGNGVDAGVKGGKRSSIFTD